MSKPRTTPSSVKNGYLRENISFTRKMTLETGTSLYSDEVSHTYWCNYTNSVDPDEMQLYAAFHLGLHSLPNAHLGTGFKTIGLVHESLVFSTNVQNTPLNAHVSVTQVWNFVWVFIYIYTLCMRAAKALAILWHICASSHEPSSLDNAMSTINYVLYVSLTYTLTMPP